MTHPTIELRKIRVNNLQDVDLDIPHGQWLSICGVSGSGKSSLALDTLYAEGQRRYVESLSPHTRQFLQHLDKPAAERIDGIPPAIAVRASRFPPGPRTTVGTATEAAHYLRLLFTRLAQAFCPTCGNQVRRDSPESVARLVTETTDARFQIAFPTHVPPEHLPRALRDFNAQGFRKAIHGHQTIELNDPASFPSITDAATFIIVDRTTSDSPIDRVRESLETAFQFGSDQAIVLADTPLPGHSHSTQITIDHRLWHRYPFGTGLTCNHCGTKLKSAEPQLFSFTSPLGACADCLGTGMETAKTKKANEPLETTRSAIVCQTCRGDRLGHASLAYQFADSNIAEISQRPVNDLATWLKPILLEAIEATPPLASIVNPLIARIEILIEMGLGYLAFDRSVRSLSRGEKQRIALASSLSSTLVNMLYILDEPSVGLHPHDIEHLTRSIGRLQQRGNTLVVIDHQEAIIRAAERVVEIGPEAGVRGGTIVFDGTPDELVQPDNSVTGEYIAGRRGITTGSEQRRPGQGRLKIVGANGNNLKNLTVEFPLNCLCVVTGVSGSGKTSLVRQTLYPAVCQRKQLRADGPLDFEAVFGDSAIEDIILIDQSPVGKSARSNPVTYVKAFDDIRKAYAETVDAKTHNLKASHFSFNVAGGRCDKCKGNGQLSVDMQFLADLYITCDQCRGRRYRDEVLSAKYRGKSIDEALSLTAREAFSFFRGHPKVQAKLKSLMDVGLDYIRLGQPATNLSSGESQRLKLALQLNASKRRSLFILDEPTTGLHMADVIKLMDCLEALLAVGHSLIVIEHNLNLIKFADWIIDLGPGAGDNGGAVVAEGTPESLAEHPQSLTGQFLRPILERALAN